MFLRGADCCGCACQTLVQLVAFLLRLGKRVLQAGRPLSCLVDLVRPRVGEVAAELELPEHDVSVILRRGTDPVSLSEALSVDSDAELADVVADRSAALAVEAATTALLPREVAKLLAPLRARERECRRAA